MAFTKEKIKEGQATKEMEKSTPNSNKDSQLDKYVAFGMDSINEIDAENIHYINESLKGINFLNEKEGEPLIPYIDMSVYQGKVNGKAKANGKESKKKSSNKGSYSPKPEKEYLEPIFAQAMAERDDIAVAEQNENITFYKWVDSHWSSMTNQAAKAFALEWLDENYPDRATGYLANSCYQTAALKLLNKKPLPPKPTTIIIPFADKWLYVSEAGRIICGEPDRNIGITYQINASIGDSDSKQYRTDDFGNRIEVFKPEFNTDDFGDSNKTEYFPGDLAANSLFSNYLAMSVPNEQDQKLLQQFFGSTLIPDTRYQTSLVMEGPAKNGKGVAIEVAAGMHQKTATVTLEKIDGFGKSELIDASLVVVPETPTKGFNEQEFKKLISGDRVVIDTKGKSQFTYKPFAKWLIACNRFPKIEDESMGVWRRVMIMKFNTVIKGEDTVHNLGEKIVAKEMKQVVDWSLKGLQSLLAKGENGYFDIPEHIKENTIKEKANSNNVIVFAEDLYVSIGTEFKLKKEDFYNKYLDYCEEKHCMPFGDVQFWKRMNQIFPTLEQKQKREMTGRKFYVNLFFDSSKATDDETENPF